MLSRVGLAEQQFGQTGDTFIANQIYAVERKPEQNFCDNYDGGTKFRDGDRQL